MNDVKLIHSANFIQIAQQVKLGEIVNFAVQINVYLSFKLIAGYRCFEEKRFSFSSMDSTKLLYVLGSYGVNNEFLLRPCFWGLHQLPMDGLVRFSVVCKAVPNVVKPLKMDLLGSIL